MAAPRTYLFVPGDRPERFAKALASGADAVVLDLEDAVAADAKANARAAVNAWAAAADPNDRARAVVRINESGSPEHAADL
jgi:citrate lyase subunit beta/citryl-CoA lyase